MVRSCPTLGLTVTWGYIITQTRAGERSMEISSAHTSFSLLPFPQRPDTKPVLTQRRHTPCLHPTWLLRLQSTPRAARNLRVCGRKDEGAAHPADRTPSLPRRPSRLQPLPAKSQGGPTKPPKSSDPHREPKQPLKSHQRLTWVPPHHFSWASPRVFRLSPARESAGGPCRLRRGLWAPAAFLMSSR